MKTINTAKVNKDRSCISQQCSPLETEAVTYYNIRTNQSRLLKVLSKLLHFCHRDERDASAVSVGNTEPTAVPVSVPSFTVLTLPTCTSFHWPRQGCSPRRSWMGYSDHASSLPPESPVPCYGTDENRGWLAEACLRLWCVWSNSGGHGKMSGPATVAKKR